MTIDQDADQIYFTDREGLRVMRCKLDGSNQETIYRSGDWEKEPDKAADATQWPVGITLSKKLNKFFWTQKGENFARQGKYASDADRLLQVIQSQTKAVSSPLGLIYRLVQRQETDRMLRSSSRGCQNVSISNVSQPYRKSFSGRRVTVSGYVLTLEQSMTTKAYSTGRIAARYLSVTRSTRRP